MSEFEPYLTKEELTQLLSSPRQSLKVLDEMIVGHREYTSRRVAETRIAEGVDPAYIKKTLKEPFGLYALEYANIGSGVAKPTYMSDAAKVMRAYLEDKLFIIDEQKNVVPATKETMDRLRAQTESWVAFPVYEKETVDLCQGLVDDPESRIYKKEFPHYDAPDFPASLSSVLTGYGSLSPEPLTKDGFEKVFSHENRSIGRLSRVPNDFLL